MAGDVDFKVTATNYTKQVFDEISSSISGVNTLLGAFGAALGAREVIAFAGHIGELGVQLSDAAKELRVNAQTLREWQHVAEQTAGITRENLISTLEKLSQKAGDAAAGNRPLIESFAKLGISQTDLRTQLSDLDALFPAVIQGLRDLGDGYQQATLAQRLMEDQGVKFLALVRESPDTVQALTNAFRQQAGVLTDEEVEAVAKAKREWSSFLDVIENRAVTAFAGTTSWLDSMAEGVNRLYYSFKQASIQTELQQLETQLAQLQSENTPTGPPGFLGLWETFFPDPKKPEVIAEIKRRMSELTAELAFLPTGEAPTPTPPPDQGGTGATDSFSKLFGFSLDDFQKDIINFKADQQQYQDVLAQLAVVYENMRVQQEDADLKYAKNAADVADQAIAIESRKLKELAKLEKRQNRDRGLNQAQYYAQALSTATAGQKSLFEVSKAAAIAGAIINTYQSANNALADVRPWPLAIAAAVVATAAGLANVAAIASTSFGQTAPAVSGAGAGGFPAGPGQLLAPDVAVTPESQQQGHIELVVKAGDSSAMSQAVVDMLDVAINQRDVTIIKPGSRQAADLRQ